MNVEIPENFQNQDHASNPIETHLIEYPLVEDQQDLDSVPKEKVQNLDSALKKTLEENPTLIETIQIHEGNLDQNEDQNHEMLQDGLLHQPIQELNRDTHLRDPHLIEDQDQNPAHLTAEDLESLNKTPPKDDLGQERTLKGRALLLRNHTPKSRDLRKVVPIVIQLAHLVNFVLEKAMVRARKLEVKN